jgi:hypothetical protein
MQSLAGSFESVDERLLGELLMIGSTAHASPNGTSRVTIWLGIQPRTPLHALRDGHDFDVGLVCATAFTMSYRGCKGEAQ